MLHLTAPARFGGLERVVENLCGGLLARGVMSTVVTVLDKQDDAHPFVAALRARGVHVIPIVVGARAYIRELMSFSRVIRETRPDVVHTHGYRSDVLGGWAARRAGLPRVSTLHGFTARSSHSRMFEKLQLRALRGFDAVIAVAPLIAERALAAGVPRSKTLLIPNAWSSAGALPNRDEARARLGLPAGAFVLGWVGRLSYEKGADVFLNAMARLPASWALASIIGDGPERGRLEAQADTLGITDRIRLHGARSDAGQLMRAFDALVISSRTEGVPLVLLEAMDAGTPVIAVRVGGIPTVVDETMAILVPPNSPEALAKAFENAKNDSVAAHHRAERAAAHLAKEFAVDPWLDQYLAVYRKVME